MFRGISVQAEGKCSLLKWSRGGDKSVEEICSLEVKSVGPVPSPLAGSKIQKVCSSGWTAHPSDCLLLPTFDNCWRDTHFQGSTDVPPCG